MRRPSRATRRAALVAIALTGALAACSSGGDRTGGSAAVSVAPTTTMPVDHPMGGETMLPADRAAAQLATAAFQDVEVAEAAGYASTLDTLGCFQDAALGGMGVHYLDQALMDATVDIAHPEALVYELDADGAVAGLVAHEYIVPVEAWTSATAPELFGVNFHRHPTLPLWVLHTWIWKDDVDGVFADWNPAVRMCPPDVPMFGRERPD